MNSTSPNKFKAGHVRLLKAMFYEQAYGPDKSTVIYTLKDQDHQGYPSLYRLYMETNDPTEWKFATTHLDSWEHWEMLCQCTWFKPYLNRWRKELELRMKSNALARIMAEAKTSSKESFTANKYILEKGWEPKLMNAKGRPSKEQIAQAAQDIAISNKQLDDDFERISQQRVN